MAKRIFVVGFDLPGDEFEYVSFHSDQSLLDADIVRFEPSLAGYTGFESYNGRTLLSQEHSARILENGKHWRSELAAAANAGKLVVVYLAKPELRYRYTGERQFSGTGRSRVTTNIVTEISSYHAVPNVSSVEAKTGSEVKLTTTATLLIPYWKEFGELAPYEAFVDGEFTERLTNAHERGQPFTDKCLTAAKRLGVALVRTTDLFEPARYLRDHPDAEYAMQCREAIFAASGEVCPGFL